MFLFFERERSTFFTLSSIKHNALQQTQHCLRLVNYINVNEKKTKSRGDLSVIIEESESARVRGEYILKCLF